MFTKILVPLDGSEAAEHALEPALALIRAYHGTLMLLLCICNSSSEYSIAPELDDEGGWLIDAKTQESEWQQAQCYLDDLIARIGFSEDQVQRLIVKGDEAGAIIGIAEAQDVDLVIMTKLGRSGARLDLLGTATRRVLHHATCSIMVVCGQPEAD